MAKKEEVKKEVKKPVEIHDLGKKTDKVLGIEKTTKADTGRCKD